jgi:hypothetical protein
MEGNPEETADKNKRKNSDEDSTVFKKPARKTVVSSDDSDAKELRIVCSLFMANTLQKSYEIVEDLTKKSLLLSTILNRFVSI